MTQWPSVPLGEVLHLALTPEAVQADQEYRAVGILGFGRGLFARPPVSGATISAKTLFKVRKGQFIYSRLKAFEGAFGLVTDEYDSLYVSNEFPTFDCTPGRLDPGYLAAYFRAPSTWKYAAHLSTGIGARRERLHPEQLLTLLIPLPPLADQRRLVERIDALTAKIEEAKRLRAVATEKAALLLHRQAAAIFTDNRWPMAPLGTLLAEDSRNGLGARPSESPPGLPILRISAATSRPDAVVDESDYKYLDLTEKDASTYRLEPGDLLACRFNGNLHYVGRFALYRHEKGEARVYPDKLIRFRVDKAKLLPAFVRLAMNSPLGRRAIESFCATTAGNIGISAGDLKTLPVPIPPLAEQVSIIAYLDGLQSKLGNLATLQAATARELNAMLPAILDQAFKGEL